MARSLALLLLFATLARPDDQEADVAEFRLRKEPSAKVAGWLVSHDDDGFVFESLARDRRTTVRWEDLVEEDARRMRIELGLELTEEQQQGLLDGHELQIEGGGSVRGLLHSIDKDGAYWMRVRGNLLPYPKDRVTRVDPAKIGEDEVYDEDEVYVRRLARRPPKTAEEHRRLADYLYDVGNFDAARQHYDEAVKLDPALAPAVADKVGASREYLEDRAAAEVFARAKGDAVLNGRWSESIDAIRAYVERNPAVRRRGEKLIAEMEQCWLDKKQARFHAAKHEEFERLIRARLSKHPTLEEAMTWARTELKALMIDRTARRLDLSDDERDLFAATKAKGSLHWASYAAGSFTISKRAAIGQSTKREIRGDPDTWWAQGDVASRSSWLKAYAAEGMDAFEVERVTMTPCERCGGTGLVTRTSVQQLADGRHRWNERCTRCFGAREDRAVGYR